MNHVFRIQGNVKNYDWGKQGLRSMVAILQQGSHKNFKVEEKPYAELWLGTHVSGPATIPHLNNKKLLEWLMENNQTLGDTITQEFNSHVGLPFLFKVLSVSKALSIQAHPDKQTALKLHQEFPHHYPDDNHKPELAIALTHFEALCGFRPKPEIKHFLNEISEFKNIINIDIANEFLNSKLDNLRSVFTAVMTSSSNLVQNQLFKIVENFKNNKYTSDLCASIRDVFLRTYEQYPGDIGCLCLFFFNYINLESGEALFLAANEPHAYLCGDCIECMACSDNVVRAGLTPKYRDVQTLCSILTYSCKSGKENIFPATTNPNDPFVKTYTPPVKEFAVDSILLPYKENTYKLKILQSASILLIVKGDGVCEHDNIEFEVGCGTSLFISSNSAIKIKPSSDLNMFRAYCSSDFNAH